MICKLNELQRGQRFRFLIGYETNSTLLFLGASDDLFLFEKNETAEPLAFVKTELTEQLAVSVLDVGPPMVKKKIFISYK